MRGREPAGLCLSVSALDRCNETHEMLSRPLNSIGVIESQLIQYSSFKIGSAVGIAVSTKSCGRCSLNAFDNIMGVGTCRKKCSNASTRQQSRNFLPINRAMLRKTTLVLFDNLGTRQGHL